MKSSICRNCEKEKRLVNVYCPECMKNMKEFRKREKQNEMYYKALEFGAGNLWQIN